MANDAAIDECRRTRDGLAKQLADAVAKIAELEALLKDAGDRESKRYIQVNGRNIRDVAWDQTLDIWAEKHSENRQKIGDLNSLRALFDQVYSSLLASETFKESSNASASQES